jgi:tRNA(Ser,Leu) C12 N-acetylase TAN1
MTGPPSWPVIRRDMSQQQDGDRATAAEGKAVSAAFEWNVVVSVQPDAYRSARRLFGELGPVRRTDFYNLLVARVEDAEALPDTLQRWRSINPRFDETFSRIAPASVAFDFDSLEMFRDRVHAAVLGLLPRLAGKSFHVRIHRRGLRGMISSHDEERRLDDVLIEALAAAGTPGRIAFDDPDAVIAIDTVGNRAGLALWTREDLRNYPFLKVD